MEILSRSFQNGNYNVPLPYSNTVSLAEKNQWGEFFKAPIVNFEGTGKKVLEKSTHEPGEHTPLKSKILHSDRGTRHELRCSKLQQNLGEGIVVSNCGLGDECSTQSTEKLNLTTGDVAKTDSIESRSRTNSLPRSIALSSVKMETKVGNGVECPLKKENSVCNSDSFVSSEEENTIEENEDSKMDHVCDIQGNFAKAALNLKRCPFMQDVDFMGDITAPSDQKKIKKVTALEGNFNRKTFQNVSVFSGQYWWYVYCYFTNMTPLGDTYPLALLNVILYVMFAIICIPLSFVYMVLSFMVTVVYLLVSSFVNVSLHFFHMLRILGKTLHIDEHYHALCMQITSMMEFMSSNVKIVDCPDRKE